MSYSTVLLAVHDRLGPFTPTQETIRQYHRGDDAAKRPDLLLICALADIYGVNVRDLSETYAEQIDEVSDLLKARISWSRVSADQLALDLVA